jgi:predicted RNase H-like nuclease
MRDAGLRAVGLDRTRQGWAAVTLDAGVFVECRVLTSLADVGPADRVAVDMPMWHPPAGERRASELEARRVLGRRASTVFLTPPVEALASGWDHARRHGVSKQMWNLAPGIAEVLAHRRPHWIEVHPEVVFASLWGSPLPPKKTWAGIVRRRHLLAGAGVDIPDELGPAGSIPADDILDAGACALVASRHPHATRALGTGDDLIWTLEGPPPVRRS